MPDWIFAATWIAMAVGYTYSGYSKLINHSWLDGNVLVALPIVNLTIWAVLAMELLFAPLALLARFRPMLWTVMLVAYVLLIHIFDLANETAGVVMLHAFTFDPGWVRARGTEDAPDTIFYDGECGLCHRVVRFVLSEDRANAFRFAPLQSEIFEPVRRALPGELPDSVIVHKISGEVLFKSDAIGYILERLGGIWLIMGKILIRLPRGLRDSAYDWIAARRKRLFGTAEHACPLLPPHLQTRFL
jgi:predicted DCC family thiol-disulfide oxidoreductase YuxK